MIKLIVSDVDGTLVKDSSTEIEPEFIDLIEELVEEGYIFTVASGRTYASVSHMFRRVKDKIAVIAENGAHITYQGRDLSVTPMKTETVKEIIEDLRPCCGTEGCDILVSTKKGSLIEGQKKEFADFLINNYRNHVIVMKDVLDTKDEILKISLYRSKSVREIGENRLIPKWQDRVQVCMAGEEWVDFMDASVDKGMGLKLLLEKLHLKREEAMAFGDNFNDVGMLREAGISYAVENAREEVKASADYVCPSYENKGVYNILLEVKEGRFSGAV